MRDKNRAHLIVGMDIRVYGLGALVIGALALSSVSSTHASSPWDEVKVTASNGREEYERDVDEVALASQEKAASKLVALLKKYRKSHQEPVLLQKLAEVQQQSAAIRFRIAHSAAHGGKKAVDLASYQKNMKQSIETLTELINRFPHFEELATSYYMRGKAYEEIDNKQLATKDYLHLVSQYPNANETISAYMALAEFCIQDNNHAKAIEYLGEVEKHPDDSHYPFALYKLAWAHYNLKNIPRSLSYVERHVAYYSGKATTSDIALRENMLLDSTVFFLEGFEQKLPQYQVSEALPYFKKLESGPILGKMLLRYAKLLRSHSHDLALNAWKDHVLVSESDRAESLDVLLTAYEHQLNNRKFALLTDSAQDMVRLYKTHPQFEGFIKAQKALLDTADLLQKMVIKNKGADGVVQLSTTLATIYDSFTKVVDEKDPRIPGVHYNLAETLFEIKEYDKATEHYRWVVDHGKWVAGETTQTAKGKVAVQDASLKAIASRYEVLRNKQLIPTELSAQPLSAQADKSIDPLLNQWLDWISTHISRTKDSIDNFYFEANRALYAHGRLETATDRMRKFALKHPDSRYAIPSASLTLDTYIVSSEWEKANDIANEFLEVKAWKKNDYSKKLAVIAADTAYKTIEILYKAKDYKATIKRTENYLKNYPDSNRLPEALNLAGNSALGLNEKDKAIHYFSRLISETPKAASVPEALLARAVLQQEKYNFAASAKDYRSYVALPSSQLKISEDKKDDYRKKILILAWLSNETGLMKEALANKGICSESMSVECDKYEALYRIASQGNSVDAELSEKAFDQVRKGQKENKSIWAALALQGAKEFGFRDRLVLIRQLASGWDELDPLVKFNLLPVISSSIPRAFQLNRMAMREVAPLRADERYITRRVEVIREMENAAAKVVKMPWSRVRAATLSEIAELYLDLSKGLQNLPAPKSLADAEKAAYEETVRKLVIPFEEKGQEMRNKSFEIASRFAIEDDTFSAVADPFFRDNPSLAKRLKPGRVLSKPQGINLVMLDNGDLSGKWDALKADSSDPSMILKYHWNRALNQKIWQQVAFFLQEAQQKSLISSGTLGLMKAVAYTQAGAKGEALIEIEEAIKDVQQARSKNYLIKMLLGHYIQACSKEKTQALVKTYKSVNPDEEVTPRDELALLPYAAYWSTQN